MDSIKIAYLVFDIVFLEFIPEQIPISYVTFITTASKLLFRSPSKVCLFCENYLNVNKHNLFNYYESWTWALGDYIRINYTLFNIIAPGVIPWQIKINYVAFAIVTSKSLFTSPSKFSSFYFKVLDAFLLPTFWKQHTLSQPVGEWAARSDRTTNRRLWTVWPIL